MREEAVNFLCSNVLVHGENMLFIQFAYAYPIDPQRSTSAQTWTVNPIRSSCLQSLGVKFLSESVQADALLCDILFFEEQQRHLHQSSLDCR
jgi:hypothetical protein